MPGRTGITATTDKFKLEMHHGPGGWTGQVFPAVVTDETDGTLLVLPAMLDLDLAQIRNLLVDRFGPEGRILYQELAQTVAALAVGLKTILTQLVSRRNPPDPFTQGETFGRNA